MRVQLLPPGLKEQINTPEEPAAAGWSLRLALNQKLAGSIPASGAEISHGGRPVLVQELGCDPSLYRFNSVRSPLVAGRLRSAVRLGCGTAECACYFFGRHPAGRKARRRPSGRMKARAAGEITRLKTAGANHASGFESLVFRFD